MIAKRFHTIFDLENCNEKIGDQKTVREFVEKIAEATEMNILKGPIVVEGFKSNPGLTVIVIVDFSHISIHTYTKYREAQIDIHSCKEYDRDSVFEICKAFFATPNTEIRQKEVWWG